MVPGSHEIPMKFPQAIHTSDPREMELTVESPELILLPWSLQVAMAYVGVVGVNLSIPKKGRLFLVCAFFGGGMVL